MRSGKGKTIKQRHIQIQKRSRMYGHCNLSYRVGIPGNGQVFRNCSIILPKSCQPLVDESGHSLPESALMASSWTLDTHSLYSPLCNSCSSDSSLDNRLCLIWINNTDLYMRMSIRTPRSRAIRTMGKSNIECQKLTAQQNHRMSTKIPRTKQKNLKNL